MGPRYGWTVKKSLLECPIDVEALMSLVAGSVDESTRARHECACEISDLHFVFSRDRVECLSRILPSGIAAPRENGDSDYERSVPLPRLEVLSQMLLVSTDIRIRTVRLSLYHDNVGGRSRNANAKQAKSSCQDTLRRFLRVALTLDRTFPHEEALASAMQICIDQLSGLGISTDDGWEVANCALLNFLESPLNASSERISDRGDRAYALDNEMADQESVAVIVDEAVEQALTAFSSLVDSIQGVHDDVADVVLKLPGGAHCALVKSFYDTYLTVCIDSVEVSESSGIRVLRVNPPERVETNESNLAASLGLRADGRGSISNASAAPTLGFRYHLFLMDVDQQFGRGGKALESLATDLLDSELSTRTQESLHDVEVGDVECLCAGSMVVRLASVFADIVSPFFKTVAAQPQRTSKREGKVHKAKTGYAMDATSISVLFASNDLVPFSRLTVEGCFAESTQSEVPSHAASDERSLRCRCQSIIFGNLSPGGELYPDALASISDNATLPIQVEILISPSKCSVDLKTWDIQMVFLQQFLSECNQFFLSESYGLLQCVKKLFSPAKAAKRQDGRNFSFACQMHDTSLLFPRLSSSSDMLAFECKEILIDTYVVPSSFRMPTESDSLQRVESASPTIASAGTDKTTRLGNSNGVHVPRIDIGCRGLELFTALGDKDVRYESSENASFRFLYAVDGRAYPSKPVFSRRDSQPNNRSDEHDLHHDERSRRLWKKISTEPVDLDILIDRAPHLRILITDPVDSRPNRLSLDLALSQWCLLLSIWFSNVQELPVQYPYSIAQLAGIALPPYFGKSFPEFGTKEFLDAICELTSFKSEVCVHLRHLRLRCSFDKSYFGVHDLYDGNPSSGICVQALSPVIHIANDHVGITRVGSGCTDVTFVDEDKTFKTVLDVRRRQQNDARAWADLSFGLRNDYSSLTRRLPQQFQLAVCMSPKWTLYNLGIDCGHSNLADFSSIFRLLEFVSSYFSESAFGHPAFDAMERNRGLKSDLLRGENGTQTDVDDWDLPGNNLDFRLWLVKPRLIIPCDPSSTDCPGVRADADGLWYHYSSLRTYSVQEVVARRLRISFDDSCGDVGGNRVEPSSDLHRIVDGLSFGLCLDFNYLTNHSGYAFQIPFEDSRSCSLLSARIAVAPLHVAPESICNPFEQPVRYLGKSVCDITFVFEVLPLVSSAILKLFGRTQPESAAEAWEGEPGNGHEAKMSVQAATTFSLTAKLADFRLFVLDPVLGPHLPVGVVSVSTANVTASRLGSSPCTAEITRSILPSEEDFALVFETVFWADYFKLGQTRSWEPLLEPYRCSALYEKSERRGTGISISSDNPLHVNVSGALLVIIDEVIDSFRQLINQHLSADAGTVGAQLVVEQKQVIEESVGIFKVVQELPTGLKDDDRVAFSIRNMTGQKIRLRKPDAGSKSQKLTVVSYLNHTQSTQLLFRPSISVIRNMAIADVDFPGFHTNDGSQDGNPDNVARHSVDIQVPGFHWLPDIKIDAFGRSFVNISPRLPELAIKASRDWRLSNVFKLLIEVGLQNGGRQVTVKSLFSVANRTAHNLSLVLNPDPAFEPELIHRESNMTDDAVIAPGEAFHVPTLLIESSLRQPGSHIGSIWLRPCPQEIDNGDLLEPFVGDSAGKGGTYVEFSSRPLQLAKIVSESVALFESNNGNDVSEEEAQTGLQASCPVVVDSNERLSPFCYAVEVSRSPLVKAPPRDGTTERVHGPVAYTLSIYPTFVVANLLPERGRFELMHAVRRTVVWFADLEPGQLVSVHSVGLDAPLLLLINLGFCKTPVGEGALVHHGSDQPRGAVKGKIDSWT